MLCLAATALFTACEPEDDDFYNFRPVDFFITADRLLIDVGQSITYQDSSLTGVSREWMFEGGNPAMSTDAMPTVNYAAAGSFLTFVTTTFADGSKETRRLGITVVPEVVADFSATPSALQKGGTVQFQNQTTGVGAIPPVLSEGDSAIIYAWFVPGVTPDTLYESNPQITFPETGLYDVSLRVTRRATGFTNEITKTDFIQTFDDPVTQSRNAVFNRDGSAILLALNEATGTLAGDLASRLSITGSGGPVAISSVEKPVWADHIVQINVNPADLTVGEDYTLTFDEVGTIVVGSGSVLLPFSYNATFLGEMQSWAQNAYGADGPNAPVTATLNGKQFTFAPSGITFAGGGAPTSTVFMPNAAGYMDTYHNSASTYAMQIIPGDGATLDDIGDVAIDISWLSGVGTAHTFSHPITDVRFHNTGGFPAMPTAVISNDGKTLTLTNTPPRNQNLRISAILEGPIGEGGFSVSHNAPLGVTIYTTASGR